MVKLRMSVLLRALEAATGHDLAPHAVVRTRTCTACGYSIDDADLARIRSAEEIAVVPRCSARRFAGGPSSLEPSRRFGRGIKLE